jgi:hypothetical protein
MIGFRGHLSARDVGEGWELLPSFVAALSEYRDLIEASRRQVTGELEFGEHYVQSPTMLYRLAGVRLFGTGAVATRSGMLVRESLVTRARVAHNRVPRRTHFSMPRQRGGMFLSLLHLPWAYANLYHWTVEVLPRAIALLHVQGSPVRLVIPDDAALFQRKTLEALLQRVESVRVVPMARHARWDVESLLLPDLGVKDNSGFLHPDVHAFTRTVLLGTVSSEAFRTRVRLFVSRSTAAKRRIKNEDELWPIAARAGFCRVAPEKLTYPEQVRLFRDSSHVVAPHGAALTNILCGSGTRVLELQPRNRIRTHYALLAACLRLSYHCLLDGEADTKQDFSIDRAAFANMLEVLLLDGEYG